MGEKYLGGRGGKGHCGDRGGHLASPAALGGIRKQQPRSETNWQTRGCMVGSGNHLLLAGILPHGGRGSSRMLSVERRKSFLKGRSNQHNAAVLIRQRNLMPVLLARSRQVSCLEMGSPLWMIWRDGAAIPAMLFLLLGGEAQPIHPSTAHPSRICPGSTQRCPPWEPPR